MGNAIKSLSFTAHSSYIYQSIHSTLCSKHSECYKYHRSGEWWHSINPEISMLSMATCTWYEPVAQELSSCLDTYLISSMLLCNPYGKHFPKRSSLGNKLFLHAVELFFLLNLEREGRWEWGKDPRPHGQGMHLQHGSPTFNPPVLLIHNRIWMWGFHILTITGFLWWSLFGFGQEFPLDLTHHCNQKLNGNWNVATRSSRVEIWSFSSSKSKNGLDGKAFQRVEFLWKPSHLLSRLKEGLTLLNCSFQLHVLNT